MTTTIKLHADGVLDVLAIPFGGPLAGRDLDGDYFSRNTDLCLSWFPKERPLLWNHATDADVGVAPIGTVDAASARKTDEGWWVRAVLDRAGKYAAFLRQLLEQNPPVIFASSGAMGHLVKRAPDREILVWPWVELSLTPEPANPYAKVTAAAAKRSWQAAGLALPPLAVAPAPAADPALVALRAGIAITLLETRQRLERTRA